MKTTEIYRGIIIYITNDFFDTMVKGHVINKRNLDDTKKMIDFWLDGKC